MFDRQKAKRIFKSVKRAVFLLWRREFKRCSVLFIYWGLRKYPRIFRAIFAPASRMPGNSNVSRDPVLIYQMGKVGSTSLLYSLQYEYLRLGYPEVGIHHIHHLDNLDAHQQYAREVTQCEEQVRIIGEYKQIRRDFDAPGDGHWNVISLVRDPVARNISAYFHNIDHHLPGWQERWKQGRLPVDEVLQSFLGIEDDAYYWFETELIPVLGIDVYSSDFPSEVGYQIYYNLPKATLLIMRLEDLTRVVGPAMETLLGIKEFKTYSFNIGHEKGYSDLYKAFRAIPLPEAYVKKAYNTKLARHFYTESELRQFEQKWTRTGISS